VLARELSAQRTEHSGISTVSPVFPECKYEREVAKIEMQKSSKEKDV
jgi:hypothetical protein